MFGIIQKKKEYYLSLIKLGVPIIVSYLGFLVTGLADTIMVGHHSTQELAAASFVNNVTNVFVVFGTGFSCNLIPLIGQNLVKKKFGIIGRWLKNSLVANLTIALLVVTLLSVIYLNVEAFGQPEELYPFIKPYFLLVLTSVVFVMLTNTFRQFLEGISRPSVAMWILLTGNFLNIIGNYILIYGRLGLPELGLTGAGISTLLSRLMILLMFLAVFMFSSSYRPYRRGFSLSSVTTKSWKKLNVLGFPIGLQQSMETGTFCITAIMVGWLGSRSLAAHQITVAISLISFALYLGIGSAVAIQVSYAKGKNDWEMVRHVKNAGLHLALFVVTLLCVVLYFVQNSIGLLFTDDRAVNDIVKLILPIFMLYQFGDCIQIVLTNTLRGLADVKIIMWVAFVAYFVIALPVGYFCGFVLEWGISGLWLAYPIGFACAALLLNRRIRHQINKHLA